MAIRYLSYETEKKVFLKSKKYLERASELARMDEGPFFREGAVLVSSFRTWMEDGEERMEKIEKIIGEDFSSPPQGEDVDEIIKKCPRILRPIIDYCSHPEAMVIGFARKKHSDLIKGSTMYISRVNEFGEEVGVEGRYCVWCSNSALKNGIEKFRILDGNRIVEFPTEDYKKSSLVYTLGPRDRSRR